MAPSGKSKSKRPRPDEEKITSKNMRLRDPSTRKLSSKLKDDVAPPPKHKAERAKAILAALGEVRGKTKERKLDSIQTPPERKKTKRDLVPTMSSPRKSGKETPNTSENFVVQPRSSPRKSVKDTNIPNQPQTLPSVETSQLPPAPPIRLAKSVSKSDICPPRPDKKKKVVSSEKENPNRKLPAPVEEDNEEDPDYDPDQPDPDAAEFEHSDRSEDEVSDDENNEVSLDDEGVEEDDGIDLSSIPSIRCKSRGYVVAGN